MDKAAEVSRGASQEAPASFGQEPYLSRDWARSELDNVWARVWQHACRVEEIPHVGDYVTYEIGNDSVIIVRSAPDRISAFHNVCSHRNRRLTEGHGHATGFQCRYHAWRYDLTGACTHVHDRQDWGDALTPQRIRLQDVRVDSWGGWVFINLDPDCQPLRDYLEPAATMLDPFELEKMRYRWRLWTTFECNWKTAQEAFMEAYHVEGTHPQLMKQADFFMWSRADGLHSHHGFRARTADQDVDQNNTILRTGRGDARISTAKLQREIWETVNARTTETLVRAAERLVDELPEGTPPGEVAKHWLASARRDDAARGVIWPTIDPEHAAKAGSSWSIFPNLAVGHGITFALCYRVRPYRDEPEKCIFEAYVIERFPEGSEPDTEWVYAAPDDVEMWRPVLLQDFANMIEVQKGMKSRAARPMLPNPVQEMKVINFHRNLARLMGGWGAVARLEDERTPQPSPS
jgi:nitrite reductase/ring-hydroxylating ferredoxin subunit